MNISLTPTLEQYVRTKVASGLYNNASELIREALRLLLERERAVSEKQPAPARASIIARLLALKNPLAKLGVASISLFGSVAHDAANAESDVDVLIQLAPRRRFSLVDLVAVRDYLQEQLKRPVDVVTRDGLDAGIRSRVLREAVKVF